VVEAHAEVVAEARHEDEVDLATEADVEDLEEDSVVAVEEVVASQEAVAAAASRAVVVVVVALADADVEATRAAVRLLWSFARRVFEGAA